MVEIITSDGCCRAGDVGRSRQQMLDWWSEAGEEQDDGLAFVLSQLSFCDRYPSTIHLITAFSHFVLFVDFIV